MIYVEPNTSFEASVDGAPTGLTGVIGVRVLDTPGNTVMVTRFTAGITENPPSSGIYSATLTSPDTLGTYSIVWDTGGGTPTFAQEDLIVTSSVAATIAGPALGSSPLTLEDLRNQCLDHQFSSTKYSDYCDAKLNEAQSKIAAEVDFRGFFEVEDYVTTTGVAGYELPDDFMRLDSLTQVDAGELAQLQQIALADYDLLDSTTQGRPTAYTVDRQNIMLYPTPGALYDFHLRYYRQPARMVVDGDYPEIPAVGHDLMVNYALSKLFAREHQTDLAQFHRNEYERDLAKLKGQLQFDTDDANQTEVVPGMWGDESSWPLMQTP